MRSAFTFCLGLFLSSSSALAQAGYLQLPQTVSAGAAWSLPTHGAGQGVLYIVGPGQVLKRTFRLGDTLAFSPGELYNAGHYTAFLVSPSATESTDFDVTAATQPESISFLAKPSRLPVSLQNGISGVAYLFDTFQNLMMNPVEVSFQLFETGGAVQERTVTARNGVAWVRMNSASRAGIAQFRASAGKVTEKRVVQQVPGDPCSLRMTAHLAGRRIALETEPVRDCSGNPVPDGTVVTFTESYHDMETTVDVPIKRGVARIEMPANNGAVISVATGVVLGNTIKWEGGK